MESKLKEMLTKLRSGLEKIYGDRLAGLILFGSNARGEAEVSSDIDVMVVLKGEIDTGREIARTSELRAGLSLDNDVVISCVYISEEKFRTEQSPLMINVRREGIAA